MGTVKCCEVRVVKANLLPLLFGCLGVIMGFALRDAFFAPSVSLEQVPTFLESANQGQVPAPVPAQEERYVTTIVNPTFPLQVKGEWDPLKIAAEEMSQGGESGGSFVWNNGIVAWQSKAAGGNVGLLDGSVHWRNKGQLSNHIASTHHDRYIGAW